MTTVSMLAEGQGEGMLGLGGWRVLGAGVKTTKPRPRHLALKKFIGKFSLKPGYRQRGKRKLTGVKLETSEAI